MAIVSDPIVVVTAADEGYTMPLAVMGRSLLGSLDPGRRVHLYVIADRVTYLVVLPPRIGGQR